MTDLEKIEQWVYERQHLVAGYPYMTLKDCGKREILCQLLRYIKVLQGVDVPDDWKGDGLNYDVVEEWKADVSEYAQEVKLQIANKCTDLSIAQYAQITSIMDELSRRV